MDNQVLRWPAARWQGTVRWDGEELLFEPEEAETIITPDLTSTRGPEPGLAAPTAAVARPYTWAGPTAFMATLAIILDPARAIAQTSRYPDVESCIRSSQYADEQCRAAFDNGLVGGLSTLAVVSISVGVLVLLAAASVLIRRDRGSAMLKGGALKKAGVEIPPGGWSLAGLKREMKRLNGAVSPGTPEGPDPRTALRGFRALMKLLTQSVSETVNELEAAGAEADSALEEAIRGQRLAAKGFLKRVEVYETSVITPDGEVPLNKSVSARVEVEGQVQTEQGWVLRSDVDNRVVFLHVSGSDWVSTVRWNLEGRSYWGKVGTESTAEHRKLAETINMAAGQAEQKRDTLERQARKQLNAAARDRLSTVDRLIPHLTEGVTISRSIEKALTQLDPGLSLDPLKKERKLASEMLKALRAEQTRLRAEFNTGGSKTSKGKELKTASVESSDRRGDGTGGAKPSPEPHARNVRQAQEQASYSAEIFSTAPDGAVDDAALPEAKEAPRTSAEIIETLKGLASLHNDGVLTDDEYEAKRKEMLNRL